MTSSLPAILAAVLLTGSAEAFQSAVVSGVVLERISGAPMARSRVRLDRIDATGRVLSASLISGRSGQFTFSGLQPGLYVLTAMREGYASVSFGQRRAQGTAPPFAVEKDSNIFAELRLRKLAAITGRVLDENRIGIRRVSVSAYPLQPPFRSVATAEADDRGVYRLHGLMPGWYRVRSAPFRHDDGSAVLPTFTPETHSISEARIHAARLDSETPDADLTPIPGELISIEGAVSCAPVNPGPVEVVVSTETGRRLARTGCLGGFRFDNLAPGSYELFASTADGKLAAFVERRIYQNALNAHLDLRPTPDVQLSFRDEDGRSPLSMSGTVTMRRVDLAGVTETRQVDINSSVRTPMLPGWWEFSASLPLPNFLERVNQFWRGRNSAPRPTAHPDWHEVQVETHMSELILPVSTRGCGVTVSVVEEGKPVAGIPVFLWPVAPDVRRRSGGPRSLVSNLSGEARFEGLAPGEYRAVASFDFDQVDEQIINAAQAVSISIAANEKANRQITPFLMVGE